MKNVLKKLLSLGIVATTVFTFSLTSHAEEAVTEEVAIQEITGQEVVEEEIFNTIVTLTIGEEYNFVLKKDGTLARIEGPNEALIAKLIEEEKTLKEAIQAIVASYDEEVEYKVVVTSSDEELAAAIIESLKEVVDEEVETQISKQPEFITKRFEVANQLGITPGKMHLLEKLTAAVGEEINYEEWAQKPVKEIMSEIKEIKTTKSKPEKKQDKSQGRGKNK